MTTLAVTFTTLPAAEAAPVVAAHPELLAQASEGTVIVAFAMPSAGQAAELEDLVRTIQTHRTSSQHSRDRILRVLLPTETLTTSGPVLEQVQRNAKAQAELAHEFGLLTSSDVARNAGSTASNPAALASRWRKEHRIFSIEVDRSARYPGYQFTADGRPRDVIADVLRVWKGATGWELALWFTASNSWLGGQRPVDVFDTDAGLVVDAAGKLADEILT